MTQPSILLAESDILIRTPLAAYLRDCGYKVLEASTGAEAQQLLEFGEYSIDVVLASADLEGDVSGFALAQWVRAHKPSVQIRLAGTIEKEAKAAEQLCEKGPHLARPYDHKVVLDLIKRLRASRA